MHWAALLCQITDFICSPRYKLHKNLCTLSQHTAHCIASAKEGTLLARLSLETVGFILLWESILTFIAHTYNGHHAYYLSPTSFCLLGWKYCTILLNTTCSFKNHNKISSPDFLSLCPLYAMPELSLGTWWPGIRLDFPNDSSNKNPVIKENRCSSSLPCQCSPLTLREKLFSWGFLRNFTAAVPVPSCPTRRTLAQLWPKGESELRKLKWETQAHWINKTYLQSVMKKITWTQTPRTQSQ